MKDLIVLVADKDMEHTVRGLLQRPQALGIGAVEAEIFVHSRHDPGCVNEAHDFLRAFATTHRHALVMFDHEGCGHEQTPAETLAAAVTQRLAANGWQERAATVVLAPELEAWMWSDSPHVAACLGWAEREPSLRAWLEARGWWSPDETKPKRPKEARDAVLREVRKPRSSAIYLELASKVSLSGHSEPAFLRFTQILHDWFPP